METISGVINVIVVVGNVIMAALLAYNLYLSLYGFKRGDKSYADQPPQARFLILVPAHNEEAVIADMVRNLSALDYPKELYDFHIIADNCGDRTASIAREMGARVIETRSEGKDAPTGKPVALRKALMSLPDYAEEYDLLMIFDADNLMDANILREVNSQYISENKPEIIQCYLGSKNREGLVAMFYHVTYTITNRFSNLSKTRLGLNVAVGGTGFAIRTSYLKARGGWTTTSLTEDFEMQIDVALSGGRILWNHNVRIYDEKPTNLLASFRQRVRWSQGHWFVALHNTPRLFHVWAHGKVSFAEMLSLVTYMYSMAAPVFSLLLILINAFSLLTPVIHGNALAVAMNAAQAGTSVGGRSLNDILRWVLFGLSAAVMLVYSFILLYWRAEQSDNGYKVRWRSLPVILLSYLVNLLNVSVAQVIGLFMHKRQDKWVKTTHKIAEGQTAQGSEPIRGSS